MTEYLACLKRARGVNDPECRLLAKAYLKCRMDRSAPLPYLYIPLDVSAEKGEKTKWTKGKGQGMREKMKEKRITIEKLGKEKKSQAV